MDAAGTVREFMAAGRLDQAVFNRVVGQLIRQAGSGGRPRPVILSGSSSANLTT